MLALAFTLDDAPSVREPGVPFDPARMDRCREILTRWSVSHCVAFVVGERAEGHEPALERWLSAGFELGNHLYVHEPASRQPIEHFADSLARCDELLVRIGAFDAGRRKWFRFPQLDRGRDPAHRARLVHECERLGYRVAPATVDFFDHPYEAPLSAALARRDERDAARVDQRFLHTCLEELDAAAARSASQTPALRHVGFAHFGPIAERNLGGLLHVLRARDFELCSLADALDHPVYRDFDADLTRNGLIVPAAPRDLRSRLGRKIALAVERLVSFDRRRYGPLKPR